MAYGSNVNRTRFMRYLEGDESHVGARDASAPTNDVWAVAPLDLRFAGMSQRWGGGVCFVDPNPHGHAYIRAWEVTAEQFEDIFAQENRRAIGEPFDWQAVSQGPAVIGSGWYGQVLHVDLPLATAKQPALTFTWSKPLPLNPPSFAYRETVAAGLAEHPNLSPTQINGYLPPPATA